MVKKWRITYVVLLSFVSVIAYAQLPSLIDLNVPPGPSVKLFRVFGDDPGDRFGESFAYADINGDGADDIVVGALAATGWMTSPAAGEVYVVYGRSGLTGTIISLNTDGAISPLGETRILGDAGTVHSDKRACLGEAVTAGDVNGDGFDDVIASAYLASPYGRTWAGTVFVFYGGATFPRPNPMNLHTDGVASEFGVTRFLGKGDYYHTGCLALASGDFNGDGFDDIGFGGWARKGEAHIFFGKSTLPGLVMDLNAADGAYNETTILGGTLADPEYFPQSSCTGDVNGDGFDDFIMGVPYDDPAGRIDAGAVYIVYGSAVLPHATVDLRSPVPPDGVTYILGVSAGDRAGSSVACGDVDGDGFDDVVVGAPWACPAGRTYAGEAYVIYGHTFLPGTAIDLNTSDPSGETRILGDDGVPLLPSQSKTGKMTTCADVNGDGLDDVIVGAADAKHAVPSGIIVKGETYVIYGRRTGLREATLDLSLSPSPMDVRVLGEYYGLWDGSAKCGADLDMDGVADLAIYVMNKDYTVPGTVANAGGLVTILGKSTAMVATAAEKIKAGSAPSRGVGGRLSPVLRTWLSFQEGNDGHGGASLAKVTVTRSDAAVRNLGPLENIANVVWEVNSDRVGCTSVDVVFEYLDSEIAGLTENDMQLFEAMSLSGPWTPVENQALDIDSHEIGGSGTGRYFAIADQTNTCPTVAVSADVTIQWTDQAVTIIPGQAFDPDSNASLIYRWLNTTGGDTTVLSDWMPTGPAFGANLDIGALPQFPIGESVLRLEVSDGSCTVFGETTLHVTNSAPVADAGGNVMIVSSEQATTVLLASASDADGDTLTYRWLLTTDDSSTVLLPFTPAGALGETVLDLSYVQLSVGQHSLRLEVTDGMESASDDMVLTIDNAPPSVALVGCGTYNLGDAITVGGSASDFDGDLLNWSVVEEGDALATGQVQTPVGGASIEVGPVDLSALLGLGSHTLTLNATDGINETTSDSGVVTIVDTQVPTLAPVPSVSQLWPPNHALVPVTISVNAHDNSGGPIALQVSVIGDEPVGTPGTGSAEPDWIVDDVEEGPGGTINLRLRAERSGKGDGRTYTITVVAEDGSGNTSSAQVKVLAPHDRGRK